MPVWTFFDNFKTNTIDGDEFIDFDGDAIKVALFNVTAAPNVDTMTFLSELVGTNEVSGGGYTAGGEALTTRTVTETAGVVTFDADDVTWAENAGGFTNARFAILYDDTGVEATSAMVAFIDLTIDFTNTDGDFRLQFAGTGLFTLSG